MEYILATRENEVLVGLTKEVRSRGLSGEHGTWEEFLKFIDPERSEAYSSPTSRADPTLLQFLTSLNKKEDLRLLAFLLNPIHPLVCKYSVEHPNETAEQSLVRMSVTHDEYPFDFMIPYNPYNPEEWVLTGILENPPFSPVPFRPKVPFDLSQTDMIAICCEKVLCSDNTEGAVRVAAVDRNLKVVFDALVEPDQPVINYRTSITGLDRFTLAQRNASPLADIQDKLLKLFHMKTIMVGHRLNRDLKALKMVHARLIDTSLVFNYDLPAASACAIEKLPRPSLDHLCKSVLGYEMQKSPGKRCVHEAEATMKLVLAILKRGAHTSIPLPDEMLKTDESRLLPKEMNLETSNNSIHPWRKICCVSLGSSVHRPEAVANLKQNAPAASKDDEGTSPIKPFTVLRGWFFLPFLVALLATCYFIFTRI